MVFGLLSSLLGGPQQAAPNAAPGAVSAASADDAPAAEPLLRPDSEEAAAPVAVPAPPAVPARVEDPGRPMGVTGAAHVLAVRIGERGIVQSRGPVVGLDGPVDVAVLVPRRDLYRGLPAGPGADRVLLAAAVAPADGSGVALRPFGAAGIEELWVVDPVANTLQVHRGADRTGYAETRFLGPDEPVSPHAFPDLIFRGSDFLGDPAD